MLRTLACVALVACAITAVVARPSLIEKPALGIETDGQTETPGPGGKKAGEREGDTERLEATYHPQRIANPHVSLCSWPLQS